MLRNLIFTLSVFFLSSINAMNLAMANADEQFCLDQGGELIAIQKLDKRKMPIPGTERNICRFTYANNERKFVLPETLNANKETFARAAFKKGGKGFKPVGPLLISVQFCMAEGGNSATWRSIDTTVAIEDRDEFGLCLFPDHSGMSNWTLFNGAERLPWIEEKFLFQY